MSLAEELNTQPPNAGADEWLFTENELDEFISNVPDRKAEEDIRMEVCSFIRQLGIDIRV